jgi:hypothetical protein
LCRKDKSFYLQWQLLAFTAADNAAEISDRQGAEKIQEARDDRTKTMFHSKHGNSGGIFILIRLENESFSCNFAAQNITQKYALI